MNTVMETLPHSALGWNSLTSRMADTENGSDFVDPSNDHFLTLEHKYDSGENSRDRNSSCMNSIDGLTSKRSKNNCDPNARYDGSSIGSAPVKVEDISSDSLLDDSNGGLSSWTCGNDAAQMDIYRDLILRHLIQDISTTCAKLSLPTDPFDWTVDQCSRWINEMCVQFQLPVPTNLRVDGRSLLNMTPEEFCVRTPQGGGDTLHAQLQLWKTAFESYQQQQHQQQPQQVPYQQKGANKGMQANSDWLSPSSPNEQNHCSRNTTASDRLPSVHGYLNNNNFNQNTSDVSNVGLNYYNVSGNGYPGSCTDSIESPSSLMSNQQFFPNAPHSNLLPSPSDTSDMSSNASSVMDDDCMDHLQLLGLQRGSSQMHYGNAPAEANCFGPLNGLDKSGADAANGSATPFQRSSGTVHLWHFIRELLDHPKQYSSCVRWVDREEGTFKIESSHHLARFWGQRKNRSQMNYDKLSRSLRQYYKKGIIQKPEKKQRLVYKFLPPYNL